MKDRKIDAGLPGSQPHVERLLRVRGIDPDRLSIFFFGRKPQYLHWLRQLLLGLALWAVSAGIGHYLAVPEAVLALLELVAGFLILHGACLAFINSSMWLAARLRWSHYVAGTVIEIAGTLPELAVIVFLALKSPAMALMTALVTIYNNTLLFSLYSFFLPKNNQNKFVMPVPITESGTQVLVAGAAIAISSGIALLISTSAIPLKAELEAEELSLLALGLLVIFAVYMVRLLQQSKDEEEQVQQTLQLDNTEQQARKELVYKNVEEKSWTTIISTFLMALFCAVLGGYLVSSFAETAVEQLQLNLLVTCIVLAFFAGMSEVILLMSAHRKGEYGIALANAFGGIVQVMFLILPYTLLVIAGVMLATGFPVGFEISRTMIILVLFLFPIFYVLADLLEADHTFDLLDATIMTVMIVFLMVMLIVYGG